MKSYANEELKMLAHMREQFLRNSKQQVRLQTSLAQTNTIQNATGNSRSAYQGWLQAEPFENIPTLGTWQRLRKLLPGGDHANLDPHQLIMALKNELGPIYRIKGYFGRPDSVITHNADDFEKVVRNEGTWPIRPTFGGMRYHRSVHRADFYQGVEGLVATQGQKWSSFRSVVNPILLKPHVVRMYIDKMSRVNKGFIERIIGLRDPHTFEVPATFEDEVTRWSLESVGVVALDKQLGLLNTNGVDAETTNFLRDIRTYVTYSLEASFKPPIWKLVQTKSFRKLMETQDGILSFTMRHVDEALQRIEEDKRNGLPEKPERDQSVLEKLVRVDKKIATVMAMDMFFAGADTTSGALLSLLLCLATNTEKQSILREEILQALPHKDSTFEENTFRNMPYLRACLKESLRMYPVIWGGSRLSPNELVLSGYRVPKRTPVAIVATSLLNNDRHYPRAKEFLPERWLRANEKSTECPRATKNNYPFIYIPFGFGARQCIGRRFAEQELQLLVAYLVRNFHIEYNYPTENAFRRFLFMVPNIPFTFKFSDVDK